MRRSVALFEFSVWDSVSPLVSGLLESSACQRAHVREAYEFQKYSYPIRSAPLDTLVNVNADVYAISCYVWNTGFVMKQLLPALLARHKEARILLGGPQVMHKAERYLSTEHGRVAICNGEGELTFTNYLEELLSAEPDLSRVKGLSFYSGGVLTHTSDQERLQNFDEHPSPYLDGRFDGRRFMCGVVETNRGCPFKCTFCYWGAAINSKVRSYPMDRVLGEIEWLSRNEVYLLFIADANLGILRRDHTIVEFIADCRKKYGFPKAVTFSASKNTPPERNANTLKTFSDAGMLATLPISIQSFSPTALKHVERSNISTAGYIELQRLMNERGNNASVELIWPLPGETLSSFKSGIATLLRLGAHSFNVFPLLLINNVKMEQQREKFGLVTAPDPDPHSDAELVIETSDVPHGDYLSGLRFTAHLTTLVSCHALRCVMQTLQQVHDVPADVLIDDFDRFCEQYGPDPYMDYVRDATAGLKFFAFGMLGSLLHRVAGVDIKAFDALLYAFMSQHPLWHDERVRLAFELDLLNRPYAYRNLPLVDKQDKLEIVRITKAGRQDGLSISIPEKHTAYAAACLNVAPSTEYTITYKSAAQQLYVAGMSEANYNSYCHGLLIRINSVVPQWSADGAARPVHALAP